MKTKINGIEVEGTTDEILEFLKRYNKPKPKERKTSKVYIRKKDSKRQFWTQTEINLLNEVYSKKMSMEKIQKKYFPNRTVESIRLNAFRNKIKKYPKPKKEKKVKTMKTMRGASVWIHKRAVGLQKQYQYDYEKARYMARSEWLEKIKNNHRKKKVVEQPMFNCLNENTNEVLWSMIVHIVKNRDGRLSYNDCSYSLGLESLNDWMQFVDEFTTKISHINNYMKQTNLSGKFVVQNNKLIYRK